jgi:hypothetical protein
MRCAVFVLLMMATSCGQQTPSTSIVSPSDSTAAFWRFVQSNADALKRCRKADEPVAQKLEQALHRVNPDLTFDLGVGMKPFELVISADGDKSLFPAVRRLVKAAPDLPGIKVVAFRPRGAARLELQISGVSLSAQDLCFVARRDTKPGLIALTMFVRGLTADNEEALTKAGYLLLDNLLGEYDVETKIGAIDWNPAPEHPAPPLRSAIDLAAVVDAWK